MGVTWKTAGNPGNPAKKGQSQFLFFMQRRKIVVVCIIINMSKYVYQIKGALENAQGQFQGLRVLVCDVFNFDEVDVPKEILDKDTAQYLQFRLKVTTDAINIQRLPVRIQNQIRKPLGLWLDQWVLENFYGDPRNRKSINT